MKPRPSATPLKIVLIGVSGTGKTCLVKRAVSNIFSDDTSSTIGASYAKKMVTLRDRDFGLRIWDTAGQEKFQAMTPMYYRGAHAAIIVYSINDVASFEAVDKWIASLRNNAEPHTLISLVGNKIDLNSERLVSTETGEEKAAQCAASFYEVSAKTGKGITELFEDIPERYLQIEITHSDLTQSVLSVEQVGDKKAGCC
jgi:Ras-related protein Rab-5C